jgi:hypothetical protein
MREWRGNAVFAYSWHHFIGGKLKAWLSIALLCPIANLQLH